MHAVHPAPQRTRLSALLLLLTTAALLLTAALTATPGPRPLALAQKAPLGPAERLQLAEAAAIKAEMVDKMLASR